MSRPRIMAVFADMGTFECLYKPVALLRERGLEIVLFLDPEGAAKKAFAKIGVSVQETKEADVSSFDLVLCGTNGKAQTLQRNVTLAVEVERQKRPIEIVWFGDFYLSGCEKKNRDLKPDWLTQIDNPARELALELRPDLQPDRIVALGNPSFDRIADVFSKREKIRARVRSSLGLEPSKKLVFFAASASNQFSREEMEVCLNALLDYCKANRSILLVTSFHPADPHKAEFQAILNQFSGGALVKDRLTEDSLEGLAAADAVIVQYSTEGVKASLMVPTLFVLLPSMRAYQKTRGGSWVNKFFPQIKYGAAEGVWDQREIAPALDRLLYGESDYYEALEEARKKHFSFLMDGNSTKRFVDFIQSRIVAM